DESDDEVQDRPGERRLRERVAVAGGGHLRPDRAAGPAPRHGTLRRAPPVGAAAEQRDQVPEEEGGADGGHDLTQHVVVEAHLAIVRGEVSGGGSGQTPGFQTMRNRISTSITLSVAPVAPTRRPRSSSSATWGGGPPVAAPPGGGPPSASSRIRACIRRTFGRRTPCVS